MEYDVIIPVYNTDPRHLLEAVDCVRNQTKKAKTIILIDDASTKPDTLAMLKQLSSTCKVVTCEKNGGTAVALNIGHDHCTTEWVGVFSSNDICDPRKFQMQCEYIEKHPEIDVIGTNLYSFYDSDKNRQAFYTTTHAEIPALRKGNVYWLVNHGTVMYKLKSVLAVGGYTPALRRAQDVDLWAKMYKAGYTFRNITQVLCGWRKHGI